MPNIDVSSQYPHMLYWTKQGTIKKILFSNIIPHPTFWLTGLQLGQLIEPFEDFMWPAERMNPTIPEDDSDAESEDSIFEEDEDRLFRKEDMTVVDGVGLSVLGPDREGRPTEVSDYIAGGTRVIALQV